MANSLQTLITACSSEIRTLRDSPAFAMSRGAKELFHTNFLGFLLEVNEAELEEPDRGGFAKIKEALLQVLFQSPNPPTRVVVWREKSSLDLVVLAAPDDARATMGEASFVGCEPSMRAAKQLRKDDRSKLPDLGVIGLIIEAKLKSIPTAAQLRRYNDTLKKGVLVDFDDALAVRAACDDAQVKLWNRLHLELDDVGQAPGRFLLRAYSTAPGQESQEQNGDTATDDKKKVSARSSTFAVAQARLRRILLAPEASEIASGWVHLPWEVLLKSLRSASGGGRLMMQLLKDYVDSTSALITILDKAKRAVEEFFCSAATVADLNECAKAFQSLRIHDLVGKYLYWQLEQRLAAQSNTTSCNAGGLKFEWESYTFMSNATPGLGVQYVAEHKGRRVSIGVQLQGTEYRHFVSASHPESRPGKRLLGFAKLFGSTGGDWWHEGSKSSRAADLGGFGCFNQEAFLYTRCSVANYTFDRLRSLFEQSLEVARRRLDELSTIEADANDLLQKRDGMP